MEHIRYNIKDLSKIKNKENCSLFPILLIANPTVLAIRTDLGSVTVV